MLLRSLLVCAVAVVAAPLAAAELPVPPAGKLPVPFVKQFCVECHSGATPEAGLDLNELAVDLDKRESFGRWVKLYDRVLSGEMPPKDHTQPSDKERSQFTKAVQQELLSAEVARIERDGRVSSAKLAEVNRS